MHNHAMNAKRAVYSSRRQIAHTRLAAHHTHAHPPHASPQRDVAAVRAEGEGDSDEVEGQPQHGPKVCGAAERAAQRTQRRTMGDLCLRVVSSSCMEGCMRVACMRERGERMRHGPAQDEDVVEAALQPEGPGPDAGLHVEAVGRQAARRRRRAAGTNQTDAQQQVFVSRCSSASVCQQMCDSKCSSTRSEDRPEIRLGRLWLANRIADPVATRGRGPGGDAGGGHAGGAGEVRVLEALVDLAIATHEVHRSGPNCTTWSSVLTDHPY